MDKDQALLDGSDHWRTQPHQLPVETRSKTAKDLPEKREGNATSLPTKDKSRRERIHGTMITGRLTQMVEYLAYTEVVVGSSPTSPTNLKDKKYDNFY